MQISITDSFDLQKIADSGQCFRAKKIDTETFRFITGLHVLYIRQIDSGHYDVSCTPDEWRGVWNNYFDFNRNYMQLKNSIPEQDSFLRKACEYSLGIRILNQDHWETLISFIISQRKSIPAIKQSIELLAYTYGRPISTQYETVFSFPSADMLKHLTLEDFKLLKVGYRDKYIMDAIQKVTQGTINLNELESYSDTNLFNTLCSIHGVGRKVANCVGLFSYGRSSFAPIDTWIQKIIDSYYGGQNPFPSYGNNAGIMQQYFFYYSLEHKGEFSL